jgi:hypothetical protein
MKYPSFTGAEPCAQVGTDLFFTPDNSIVYRDIREVKALCDVCPMQDPCLEYALHVNVVGIWGGTTEHQRRLIRRERNIIPTPITKAS